MQYQDPSVNNPANPLLKVAALSLDKNTVSINNKKFAKISIRLSFKQSNDMSGRTKTTGGQEVCIKFSLAIQRASLRIQCADENGGSMNNQVTISRIAYMQPLSEKTKNSTKHQTQEIFFDEKQITGNLSGKAGGHLFPIHSALSASGKIGAHRRDTVKNQATTNSYSTNIKVTSAGAIVHWELDPSINGVVGDAKPYLQGEVFQTTPGGKMLHACYINRKDNSSMANSSVNGSVYVRMQDLDLRNISFVDIFGNDICYKQVEGQQGSSISLNDLFNQDKAKLAIMKQILRKHLVNQGMNTDGDLVEICRASS